MFLSAKRFNSWDHGA